MSETEFEEAIMLSLGRSCSQAYPRSDHERNHGEQAPPKACHPDPIYSLSADAGPGNMGERYRITVLGSQFVISYKDMDFGKSVQY